ncbi:hypothetical protein GCM10007981_16080 [Thermocladium modestius]|uniref:Uncharacterized protein n=1 Tax=Thermocladium modestius TaxID=62609 RepID=A0A830GX85_9CREN|nr:hypothetical protein [Thermocladium modestius]GGP21974.1 hypothetical protein GCM10007981_16080 [Thermocladium modestius]
MIVMLMLLIDTNYEEAAYYLIGKLGEGNALQITDGVIITWRSRESVERALLSLKEKVISKVSGEGNVELSFALIDLSEEQLARLRTMIRDRLIKLDRETYRHIDAIKNRFDRMSEKRLETEVRFLDKKYESLMNIHNKLKIMTPETEKLIDAMKELRIILRK